MGVDSLLKTINMRKAGLFILILGFAIVSNAKAGNVDTARLLTQFSFTKYLNGIILIQAQMDNHPDTLFFILDTGCNGASLDSTTCEQLQIENRLTDTFVLGVGGKKQVHFAFNRSLKMGGLRVDSLDFHINDYSFFTRVSGRKIDGIIGYSFLKRFIVAVDYENTLLQIYTPGFIQYPKRSYVFNPKVVPIPLVKATINDNERFDGSFFFDTGAKMELIVSKRFAEDKKLFLQKRKLSMISVEGVAGGEYMPVSVVSELRFGPYKFKNVPTYVFDDVNNLTAYPQNYGLIGSGIFSKFNLILNFPKGEICMKPNAHFGESFDYAYSGLSIDREEEKIVVYDIAPKSPAEYYGLKIGDEILAVDNVLCNDVDNCRDAINKRNTFIKLLIVRDGKTQYLLMKTGSII